ncbi:MAG TPA: glycosyltransferase family 1 protein, partial [Solibacterales bacterium]|nr:glycosyltransferase family 1 protein [Bryobacterales bacterium]
EDFDALLIVGEGVGDFVALRSSVPVAGLCLTPLRVAFDPVYQARAKENRGAVARFALAAGVSAFRAVDRFAWRRYRHMLTISREAMSRADAGGLAPSGPHELLHPGIGIEHHGEPCEFQPFFLIAGRIMWTKNIELGIRAFQIFASAHPAFRLVIAGIVDAKSEGYLSQLRELADGDPRIEFRIFPTDADLRELYRTCYGLLFTPFNEDWGIVPIEAMTFGKPVIAVDAGGPKEIVVHGESGFLAAPEPEAFAAHMTALAGGAGLARGIGTAARERSRLYSWDRFTARVDDVVESVARGV